MYIIITKCIRVLFTKPNQALNIKIIHAYTAYFRALARESPTKLVRNYVLRQWGKKLHLGQVPWPLRFLMKLEGHTAQLEHLVPQTSPRWPSRVQTLLLWWGIPGPGNSAITSFMCYIWSQGPGYWNSRSMGPAVQVNETLLFMSELSLTVTSLRG